MRDLHAGPKFTFTPAPRPGGGRTGRRAAWHAWALLVLAMGSAPLAAAGPAEQASTRAEEPVGAETSRDKGTPAAPARSIEAILRDADDALARGDLKEAIAGYRRALALAPGNLDAALGLAGALRAKEDVQEALPMYEALRGDHPDDPRVLLGLSEALIEKRRYARADAILQGMEEGRVEPIKAHLARARIQVLEGNIAEAEHFYRDVARADPGNLEARIGLARMLHEQGLDRKAREQADNIVLDHPGSAPARDLQREIHRDLDPKIEILPVRRSDDGGNRIDAGEAAYTFMAEPQTAVRVDYTTYAAAFRCDQAAYCDEAAGASGSAVDRIVSARAQTLMVSATSRLLRPLNMNTYAGAAREETFGDGARSVAIGGGWLRWQVGPRFGLMTDGGREPLLDTARLIDRGIKVDRARLRLEYRLRPAWRVTGSAEYATYSDRNARETGGLAIEWRLPTVRPRITASLEGRYRRFHDDRDSGYFDPRRYDSELVSVGVGDAYRGGRLYWQATSSYGRQRFDPTVAALLEARPGETVKTFFGTYGVGLGARAGLEAFYERSDDALRAATGFTASRSGIVVRVRP